MNAKPRLLENGWRIRTIRNAVKISLRKPVWWALLYGSAFWASTFTNVVAVQMLLGVITILLGTALVYCAEQNIKTPFVLVALRYMARNPQLILISVLAIATINVVRNALFGTQATLYPQWVSDHIPFAEFGASFAAMILFMFAIYMFYQYWVVVRARRFEKLANGPADSANVFSPFAFHLTLTQEINWRAATRISDRGIALNIASLETVLFTVLAVMIVAPLIGLFLPWAYCIYREIFFGPMMQKSSAPVMVAARS